MEGMASVWSYQQYAEELKHSLNCTLLELESTRIAVFEEKKRNEEMFYLLKESLSERDEAKEQLNRLLKMLTQSNLLELTNLLPNPQPGSPSLRLSKGNSSITESDSLSETFNNHQSYGSHGESLLDAAAYSPEQSNLNMGDSSKVGIQQPLLNVQEFSGTALLGVSQGVPPIDAASLIIDQLAMKKKLPEKGKLLEAVMDAGRLLSPVLLLTGPLPKWRNPPPSQPLQIPPVLINGCDPITLAQTQEANPNAPQHDMLSGVSPRCSTALLNFGMVNSCQTKRRVFSSIMANDYDQNSCPSSKLKHQKLH